MSIYRQESFLAGKLGEKVASDDVTVIDDGTLPGLFGTSPFDDEGVASRRTVVIERGVLKSYLMNTYAARKLGLKTTGNASRGLTGNAGIGHGNFFLEKGVQTAEQIVAGIPNGFYVTELIAGRGGVVDPQRRTGIRSQRGDHRGEPERDAAWGRGDRQRPGVSRIGGSAYNQDGRNDRWW
jgi:predicted Zn-dependent protease